MVSGVAAGAFRSLRIYNFAVWSCGAVVSNVGMWMQRTAQDWLVLAQLTHHNATAVGIVLALQFGPQLLLLPLTGFAADHFDRRQTTSDYDRYRTRRDRTLNVAGCGECSRT